MSGNLLELSNITKSYGSKVALNNVNLSLEPGKIVGILGPNGSGKTTMFKTIMHIIRQQAGTIKICGEDVSYQTRKYISFMPDREYLYKSMSVMGAAKYYQEMFNDFDYNKFNELTKKLQIDTTADVEKLSKGNKEKLVLALTLSRKVPIYLLDEPLGSLDPVIKHEMLTVIKQCVTKDNVIIISTHLIKDIQEILEQVVFLKNGEIVVNNLSSEIIKSGKSIEDYYLEVFTNV